MSAREPSRTVWPLLVAPILVVSSLALLDFSDKAMAVGPFDRASFGWSIPVPMLLLAPAIAGLAARWSEPRAATALLIGLAIVLGLVVSTRIGFEHPIGCPPTSGSLDSTGQALLVGAVASLGFVMAGLIAFRLREHSAIGFVAGVLAAACSGAITLVIFGSIFAAASCVPRPTP